MTDMAAQKYGVPRRATGSRAWLAALLVGAAVICAVAFSGPGTSELSVTIESVAGSSDSGARVQQVSYTLRCPAHDDTLCRGREYVFELPSEGGESTPSGTPLLLRSVGNDLRSEVDSWRISFAEAIAADQDNELLAHNGRTTIQTRIQCRTEVAGKLHCARTPDLLQRVRDLFTVAG